MRAVACHHGELQVVDLADQRPERGQVLLEVVRCGICGSDLHARLRADEQADVLAEAGYDGFARSAQQVVFGHEFAGTVAEYGPGTRRRLPVGTPVVALPLRRVRGEMHPIGLSAAAPGGYAQQVVVEEPLVFALPNGLSPELGALTEPIAVGWHAVRRGQVAKSDVAIVIGCGPVGLAVISMLKARGVRTVVASDFSAARRQLAGVCGATVVVDPAADSPYTAAGDRGWITSISALADEGLQVMQKLTRVRGLPWQHVYRVAERLTGGLRRPVVFECVGVPGMVEDVISAAPLHSRVVVVGVCMVPDTIRPAMAINKEIDLRFVVGYSPLEFRDTLHLLADGTVDPSPLVTGTVPLGGVADAFTALRDPDQHAKILIDPTAGTS